MKPKRIILVRHGQSEGNIDKGKYNKIPDYQMKLTDFGKKQATKAGAKIKELIGEENLTVYHSPYIRTRQTYEQIKHSIQKSIVAEVEDPRLREQDWGHLRPPKEGKRIEDERDKYGSFYYRIKDGESGADVYDRASTFLETLYRDFSKPDFPENILIVTHGLTLRLLLMRWLHWTVEEYEELANPKNCQIVIMHQLDNGRFGLGSKLEKKTPQK